MRGASNRKGQVTIFIILALLIVGAAIALFTLSPKLKNNFGSFEDNPKAYIQDCVGDELLNDIETVSKYGGSMEPHHFAYYKGEKVEYLCYTPEYFRTCTVEKPMLITRIEKELDNALSEKIDSCFDSLKEGYEKRGYTVSLKKGPHNVELLPGRVKLNMNYSLSLTKKENTKKIDSFSVVVDNNLYELASLAYHMMTWEATYGDYDVDFEMTYNPNIIIDKQRLDDGTKVYIIEDVRTGQKFTFASRSVVWSAAYSTK